MMPRLITEDEIPPLVRRGGDARGGIWDGWLDGQLRIFTKGVDFESIGSFTSMGYAAAKRRGLKVSIRRVLDADPAQYVMQAHNRDGAP